MQISNKCPKTIQWEKTIQFGGELSSEEDCCGSLENVGILVMGVVLELYATETTTNSIVNHRISRKKFKERI